MTRPATHPRRISVLIALWLAAVAVFAFRVVPYLPAYREREFAHMSVEEQLRTQKSHVNDPIFLYYLGKNLNRMGQFAPASICEERAAGLDPDSPRIRDEWVRALMGSGRVTVAFGILRQYMASHPKSGDPPRLLGRFYISRQDWAPALRALESSVKLDPGNAEAWALLAQARIKMGIYGDARKALEAALAINPRDSNSHLQLAVLLASKEPAAARKEFEQAVKLAPRDSVAIRQFGRFLLDTGDAAGAEQKARTAIALNPGDSLPHLLLGLALEAQNRWQDATEPLQDAAHIAPFDIQPAEQLRRVYRQLHQDDLAANWEKRYIALTQGQDERQRLQDATQAHPTDPDLHHRLAVALAKIGDVNGCVREESFAARSAEDNPKALTAAASDLDAAGFSVEALPVARQAAQRQLNPNAHETLGYVLLHLNRLHEAAVEFEQIRDWKAKKMPEYRHEIAEALARLNASQAPAEILLRSARLEPDSAKAEAMLTHALQIDPQNTRCMRALMVRQAASNETANAATTAQTLADISPEDGGAQTCYVLSRLKLAGDTPLSKAELRELSARLSQGSKDSSAQPALFLCRGLIELKTRELNAAIKDLETAQRLNPKSADASRALAQARAQVAAG